MKWLDLNANEFKTGIKDTWSYKLINDEQTGRMGDDIEAI